MSEVEPGPKSRICYRRLNNLKPNPGLATFAGSIPVDEVFVFPIFFLPNVFPMHSQNFEHVVLESLVARTPPIIGGNTPWDRIETAGAGSLCNPSKPVGTDKRIDQLLALDEDKRQRIRITTRKLHLQLLNDQTRMDTRPSISLSINFIGSP